MGYPVLLDLTDQVAVVVGGGSVATRKAMDLLAAGADVVVISPAVTEQLRDLAEQGALRWEASTYHLDMLTTLRPLLVIAATDAPEVNAAVTQDACSLNILASAVDGTPGTFSGMSVVRRGPVTIGIGTNGAAPALAAQIRARIEAAVGDEYGVLASWMGELRPAAREHLSDPERRSALWRAIAASPALDQLRRGDEAAARATFRAILDSFGVDGRRA